MLRFLLLALLLAACGDDDGSAGTPAGASERDACDAVAQCIFGVDDTADVFADQCVTDEVFASGSTECLGCMVDLSCANLEAAFEGDADAQAMCPSCE